MFKTVWTRIKLYAEKKEQEAWMDYYRCDQKCPHCNTWQGNCGGWRAAKQDVPKIMHDTCTCNKCGQDTVFLDIGMGYIACDPQTLEPLGNKHG